MSVLRRLTLAALACLVVLPSTAVAAPQPVPSLELPRYLGTWYQIASVPQWFEAFCERNTTANYSLNADGTVRVANRCGTPWGSAITAQGNAKLADPVTGAQLKVSFNRTPWGWLYTSQPNYIVVGLGADYDWAVVTDANRTSGFVLSRTVTLTEPQRAGVLASLTQAGINPCRLQIQRQRGGATQAGRFC